MISPITTIIEVTAIRNNTITTPAATAAEVLCGARGIPCIVTMNEIKYIHHKVFTYVYKI